MIETDRHGQILLIDDDATCGISGGVLESTAISGLLDRAETGVASSTPGEFDLSCG